MEVLRNQAINDFCRLLNRELKQYWGRGTANIVMRSRIALLIGTSLVMAMSLLEIPALAFSHEGMPVSSSPKAVPAQIILAAEKEGRGNKYHWLLKERSPQEAAQQQSGSSRFFEEFDNQIKEARRLYLAGEKEKAILQYGRTIDLFESLLDWVPPGNSLLNEFEQRLVVFEEAATKILGPILSEIQEDAADRVFGLMEKRRFCRLNITLKKSGNINFFDVPPSLIEQESQVLGKLLELQQSPASSGDRKAEEDLKSKLSEIRKSLDKSSSRYAALFRHRPISLSEFQRDFLRSNELVLDITMLPDRVVAGVITKEKTTYYQYPGNRAEIDEAVFNLQDQLREFTSESSSTFLGHAWKEPCRRIYRAVLGKLPPLSKDKSSVFILPDRSLWYLPFAVLLDPEDRPFGQDRQISLIPSASAFTFVRTQEAAHAAAPDSVANLVLFEAIPWIPDEDIQTSGEQKKKARETQSEAEKVEKLILKNSVYPKPSEMALGLQKSFKKSEIYVGSTATADRLLELNERSEDIVVIAAPLYITDSVGLDHQPSLLFSPDKNGRRRLEVKRLFGVPLGARLAIFPIAWFDVPDRQAPSGEGPLLFGSAVFYAGVPMAMVNYADPNWGYQQPFVEKVMKKASEGVSPGRTILSYPKELPAGLDSSFSGKPPSWAGWVFIGDPGP